MQRTVNSQIRMFIAGSRSLSRPHQGKLPRVMRIPPRLLKRPRFAFLPRHPSSLGQRRTLTTSDQPPNNCHSSVRAPESAKERFSRAASSSTVVRISSCHSRSRLPLTRPLSLTPQRSFSSSSANMAGTKIDGAAIAKSIRERLNAEIRKTQQSNPRFQPSLVIFQGKRLHSCTLL